MNDDTSFEALPFRVAFIADIHFGALPSDQLFFQLKERFLKVLEKNPVEMLVLGGDLFHNIITMNYSTSHVVLMFMESVIELCRQYNILYVRIIQGTISHDNNQLHNFHMFENREDVDFRIIMNVEEEYFSSHDINVLYLPEEYMKDPKEYYAPYLDNADKRYDFIFGHGMVREVAFVAKSQESENTMSKAPIFESKQLINACKGPIFFGHIHIRTTVREHLYYPGSFSRWRFGEEDPKGWYLCVYDKDGKYLTKFVENTYAPEYVTVSMELTKEYAEHPELIDATLKNIPAEHLRLQITIGKVDSAFALKYLTDTYGKGSRVKIDIKNKEKEFLDEQENEMMEKLKDKYGFVFDDSLTLAEVIQKFIKAKKDKDTPIEIIEDELAGLK